MSEEEDGFADDMIVMIILDAAKASMSSSNDPDHKKYLKAKIQDLLQECFFVDETDDVDIRNISARLLQIGFEIGRSIFNEEQGEVALKELASAAGRKSGQTRREKAEREWKSHATALAIAHRGNLSQGELASEIKTYWKLEGAIPAYRTLLTHVRDLERSGRLPPKRSNEPVP